MDGSVSSRCEYEHWWRRRGGKRLRTSNERRQELEQGAISLPLPSFPPALDFDPDQFLLPPSYEEAIDVEKALLIAQPCEGSSSHASTASELVLPTFQTRQGPSLSPQTRHIRIVHHFRYTVFTVYRRLFTLVFVLNIIGVFILLRQRSNNTNKTINPEALATLASSNFLLAILVRQDFLINILFRTAWLVPWSVPLRIRTMVTRVYCYGGIHSGAAVAGTLWWLVFTAFLSWKFLQAESPTFPIVVITSVVLLLLFTIVLLAFPSIRARHHDTFEMTHRFLGWTSIALFWAQLLLLTQHESTSSESTNSMRVSLSRNPSFWNLAVITLLLIYPWLQLRRWTFTANALSSHALRLSFPNRMHKFSCLSISSSPLKEWHPFATFPSTNPNEPGASMVISAAGDWTKSLIKDAQMRNTVHQAITKRRTGRETVTDGGVKMRFWVKSHPKAGVLSLSCLFSRVLIVTTGSGIGPSLSSLLDRPSNQFARLIWSTRSPHSTFGIGILSLVHTADPDAVIIDSSEMGRPNLLEVAWKMYKEIEVEAVFILSNETVTRAVVGGLERRGVRAFGPIWDS